MTSPMPSTKTAQPRAGAEKRAEAKAVRDRHAERKDALAAAIPYLALVKAPRVPAVGGHLGREFTVATYNVHRWAGLNGARSPDAARAGYVISEITKLARAGSGARVPFRPAQRCTL